MFGKKINEFDNSNGTVEEFNKIFPKTPLDSEGYVEILDITDVNNVYRQNLYARDISINGVIVSHDFGRDNFVEELVPIGDKIRFKYFAFDLDGRLLGVAYNTKDLADKLGCGVAVVKNRLVNTIDENTQSAYLFNVRRVEL